MTGRANLPGQWLAGCVFWDRRLRVERVSYRGIERGPPQIAESGTQEKNRPMLMRASVALPGARILKGLTHLDEAEDYP